MTHLGNHILIELYDCDRGILNDAPAIEEAMKEAAIESGATIVSVHTNLFNPHGVSGVVVIAESHITIHTWPEYGYAAVDAFTCGDKVSTLKIKDIMEQRLRAQNSEHKFFKRGKLNEKLELKMSGQIH